MPALTPPESSTAPSVPLGRFLGIDWHALWQDFCRPWQGLHRWPVLAWLAPVVPVRLRHADGHESVWQGDKVYKNVGGKPVVTGRFVAIELPEDLFLRRTMAMPAMGSAEVASAVALELQSISPFAIDDLVWGFRAAPAVAGTLPVEAVLASRQQVQQHIGSLVPGLSTAVAPEVWVLSSLVAIPAAPIIMAGFGENQRQRYAHLWRRGGYVLLALMLCVLVAIAMTPTLQLRLRAIEAAAAYDAVLRRAEPLTRQRAALLQSADRLAALNTMLADRVEPLQVIDTLTRALPDDVSLLGMQVQGNKVTFNGQATNAAALMQSLGAHPGLRDVKAPTAATKPLGFVKESFVIELTLTRQVPTPTLALAPAANPASAAATPATIPVGSVTAAVSPAAPASAVTSTLPVATVKKATP